MTQRLAVLYEDNHLLVVNKPAGWATMGSRAGETTLLSVAKDYIRRKHDKPGNVYLGVVSRLDLPVSGVLVLARTSKAAARLSAQFREGDVEKTYQALVEGVPQPAAGECLDYLHKDERLRLVVTGDASAAGARQARLRYRTLRVFGPGRTWLEIELLTGRKHQIRVQLASRGWPVLGDVKYGARGKFAPGIALHSSRLSLTHPVRKERMTWTCPPPPSWRVA